MSLSLIENIDELGHVNNAVWVRWMERIAVAHWQADAAPEHRDRYIWVVTRDEIDYRGNVGPGERVLAQTHIPAGPAGARFDRTTGRLAGVTADIAAPFLP